MRATLRDARPARPVGPVQGTFYPDAVTGAGSTGPALPRMLAIVAAIVLVRMVIAGRRHHAHTADGRADGPRWGRRREALARLHRELHAHDGEEVNA